MRPPKFSFTTNGSPATNGEENKKANSTNRTVVVLRAEPYEGKGAYDKGIEFLRELGYTVAVANPLEPTGTREDELAATANAIVYPKLGIAVIDGEPDQVAQLKNLASDSISPIKLVKKEKVRHALVYTPEVNSPTAPAAVVYPADLQKLVEQVVDKVLERKFSDEAAKRAESTQGFDESQATWGLQVTNVLKSSFSGRDIRVAVLDMGIDFTTDENGGPKFHPDFEGRTIVTASFVPGVKSAKDGAGHGTHCIGTACGPRKPASVRRYGIAYEADIYAGKVLNDQGSGADGWIIAGIEWAISRGCQIVSMSLGSTVEPGETFDQVFEEVAKRALDVGTLIIAAAGNDSMRPELTAPVNGPANCPSIMAVAAIDSAGRVARFSAGEINPNGGEVNIAAPGVKVFSSFPPNGHETLSGTSMATPHVAGIAALYAQANPNARGRKLWELIVNNASALDFGPSAVGRGLVEAPTSATPLSLDRQGLGEVRILETSPIIVGGGGSAGVDFDDAHYIRSASGDVFISASDQLRGCVVLHQNGKLLRNFFPDINGKQCAVIVDYKRGGVLQPNPIRITGGPSGQLSVFFDESHFPFDQTKGLRFGADLKVFSVKVQNTVTGTSTQAFEVPQDWAGVIHIDN